MKPLAPMTLIAILIMAGISCETHNGGSRKTDESFAQPTDVQGVSCRYVVYYDDGKMKSCVLARVDPLSGQSVPEGTIVFFSLEGVMESCFLQQDTEIQGHLCKGHSDNWQTSFYPSGKLKIAWLAKDQIIQGVPCLAASIWNGRGAGTYFHENGNLASCKLARDTTIEGQNFGRGDKVHFDKDGKLVRGKR